MYDINLFHILATTRAFLGSMTAAGRGSIVNLHSVEGLRGFPGDPVYAAMKAAAAHFTTSLAVAVGRSGVRVNGIGPDLTQTPQVDYLTGAEERRRPVAVMGAGGPGGLAGGPGPGGPLPGLRPVRLRHRSQHPGGRGDQGRWRVVLLPRGREIRQPAPVPVSDELRPTGHFEGSCLSTSGGT